MKKNNHNIFILLLIVFLINCSDKINEPMEEEITDFRESLHQLLSLEIGREYNYNVDTLNRSTQLFNKIGQRLMKVENITTENGDEFIDCSQYYTLGDSIVEKKTKIIFTNNSIQYFVDSSGISSFLSDSIDFDISVSLDETAKLVQYPYIDEESWNVFNAYAHFAGSKFKVFSITGKYEGNEKINIPNLNEDIITEKFKYNGELNLPNINNPLVSNLHSYVAYVWISPDYGIVKLEGFSLFISPLTGDHFNISDSSKVFRHTLIP